MVDIFVRHETEDDKLAEGATFFDDIDLLISPRDGLLMMVAVKGGKQVCQQCGYGFDETDPRYRSAEVSMSPGSPRLKLHARCETSPKAYRKMFRGLEVRRGMAKVAKGSQAVVQAAMDAGRKIVQG
jgi:hypothetical protein